MSERPFKWLRGASFLGPGWCGKGGEGPGAAPHPAPAPRPALRPSPSRPLAPGSAGPGAPPCGRLGRGAQPGSRPAVRLALV